MGNVYFEATFECKVDTFHCVLDAPGSPGEPGVEEVGSDFVSLTWDKPRSDGGGRITGKCIIQSIVIISFL